MLFRRPWAGFWQHISIEFMIDSHEKCYSALLFFLKNVFNLGWWSVAKINQKGKSQGEQNEHVLKQGCQNMRCYLYVCMCANCLELVSRLKVRKKKNKKKRERKNTKNLVSGKKRERKHREKRERERKKKYPYWW